MKLYGLQKMTLLDFPRHVACTVFLGGCDFRCPWCHNYALAEGTAPTVMEEDEFYSFLRKRKGLLDGVAITGGEPCLNQELPAFLKNIRDLGYPVKLDTNGYHPDMLQRILDEELVDYVAMDIKNSPEKYPVTCGVPRVDLARIERSISLIMEKAPEYEFRTTVISQFHKSEDFHAIGTMISGTRQYFLQRFTDRDSVPFGNLTAPDRDEMQLFLSIAKIYVPDSQLRGVD